MLEYFAYKKYKKHKENKEAMAHEPNVSQAEAAPQQLNAQTPVLTLEDENFLEKIVSDEETPPPLPIRPSELMESAEATDSETEAVSGDPALEGEKTKGKGKEVEKQNKKTNRFSFLGTHFSKKDKAQGLDPKPVVPPHEATKEEEDIQRVLEELNLQAVNNRAFSISAESQELVRKFTVILKDLVNGVPTAYDDLVHLLDSSNGTLSKSYDSLPSFLKKLIAQLPSKLTSSLAPELLAVAAEAQGVASAGSSGGLKGAAKKVWKTNSLKDLVAKPGAVASLLRTIVNTLKLRWPAFMGTNVLLSLALFVLLFVFWYCHKRGKEVRLEREKVMAVDSEGNLIEPGESSTLRVGDRTQESRSRSRSPALPPRPTGTPGSSTHGTERDLNPPVSNYRSRDREDRPTNRD